MRALILVLLFAACRGEAVGGDPFDRAITAIDNNEFREAAKLFAQSAQTDPDPKRREEAALRLANIEWRIFQDRDAARKRIEGLPDSAQKHLALTRIAFDRRDFAAARKHADDGIAAAKTGRDRRRATAIRAFIAVEDPRDKDELRRMIALLRELDPELRPSRLLARAGLHAGDGASALEGINRYYHVSPYAGAPEQIAKAHAVLAAKLPSWDGRPNGEIASALAGIRFFDEAVIAGASDEIKRYAAMLDRVETFINDYYRRLALDDTSRGELKKFINRELEPFGGPKALAQRFRLYVNVGKTSGFIDLHMGHVVVDSRLAVDQYGRRASVRFVVLDSLVSNGYAGFVADDESGDGGWATETEVYQVRPMYADGPLRDWRAVFDAEAREESLKSMREETERDRTRAVDDEPRNYPGLVKRLRRQYLDSLKHLDRDAFLARVEKDRYTSSIVLHEGRHAIDAKEDFASWEREYRAKLSEVALAPAPRDALASILGGGVGDESPHGRATAQLARDLLPWIKKNGAAIEGLDPRAPLLPQLDKLSDEQLKAAVRSLDPLAK